MNPKVKRVLRFLVEAVANTALFYSIQSFIDWNFDLDYLFFTFLWWGIGWTLFGGYITRFMMFIMGGWKKKI